MVTRIFAFGDQMTLVFRVPFSKGDKDTEDVKKVRLEKAFEKQTDFVQVVTWFSKVSFTHRYTTH